MYKERIEEVIEILEDEIKRGNFGNDAKVYEARNKLRRLYNDLQEYTRFESQYIFMLASNTQKEWEKELEEEKKKGFSEPHFMEPQVERYIETLDSIRQKAGANMKQHSAKEKEGGE